MKRKIMAIILMLCMLLSVGMTASAIYAGGTMTIDFEEGNYEGGTKTAQNSSDVNSYFSIVYDEERGGNVLRIADTEGNHHPMVGWEIDSIIPGATYRLSGYAKRINTGSNGFPQISMSYCKTLSPYTGYVDGGSRSLSTAVPKNGVWTRFEQDFTVPMADVAIAQPGIRLHGDGELYYDDITFVKIADAPCFEADSGFFYYRDEAVGKAEVTCNTISYPNYASNSVTMKLMDGETVLEQATFAAQADTIEWNFPTGKMTEIAKSYTLLVEYKNAGGTIMETQSKEVLIYNRPTNLSKDGYLIDDDGEKYNMVVAGSLYPRSYAEMAAYGVNVAACCYTSVQMDPSWGVPYALNQAQAAGIKLLVPLYANMKPAGHTDNVQNTINCINAIKDHPALLGYMVMDEPFGHAADAGGPEGMYQWLQDSYKLIRQYDQEHIVYMVETNMDYVGLTGNCVDLLTVDPYVGSKRVASRGSHVSQDVINGIAALGNRKPLTSMVQAWPWNGDDATLTPYMPTANDIRSFLYQSLIGGADGIGYYGVETLVTGHSKYEDSFRDPDYNDLWNVGITYFNDNEWDDARKAFITGEYPTFAQSELNSASAYWYKAFVKGDDLYVVVINRNNTNTSISIPLTSLDGSVTIGSFTAEADTISGIETFTGSGTLSATLSPAQVVRFKLTVSEDLSGLTTSRYRDIYTSWAKSAIDTAYQAGVTNEKGIRIYAPEEEITRGDFALFLVRALGLTASGTDNFADVNTNVEYADAIRIGKALGFLTAEEGANYLPEEPISREDVMEITAQAMYCKETGGTAGNLSAYILDIALLMRDDIPYAVDFTENMTRAEAALVMQYILEWDEEGLASAFASLGQAEISDALALILSGGTPEAPVPSIVVNGDFEDGLTGWTKKGSTTPTVIEEASGNHYVEFDMSDGNQEGIQVKLTDLTPGTKYSLNFDVCTSGAFFHLDGAGGTLTSADPGIGNIFSSLSTGGVWQGHGYEWTQPAEKTTLWIRFILWGNTGFVQGTDYVRLDNVTVTEVDTTNLIVNGSFEYGRNGLGYKDNSNGYQGGAFGAYNFANYDMMTQVPGGMDGTYALQVSRPANATSWNGIRKQTGSQYGFAPEIGKTYEYTVYVKNISLVDNADGKAFALYVNGPDTGEVAYSAANLPVGEWTCISYVKTHTATPVFDLRVYGTGTVLIDNVSCREVVE